MPTKLQSITFAIPQDLYDTFTDYWRGNKAIKNQSQGIIYLMRLGLASLGAGDDPRRACTPEEIKMLETYNNSDPMIQGIVDQILFTPRDQEHASKIRAAINASKNKKDPEA